MKPDPKLCDHCQCKLKEYYRLEFEGYKTKDKERTQKGQVACVSCHKLSNRVLVFGGGK